MSIDVNFPKFVSDDGLLTLAFVGQRKISEDHNRVELRVKYGKVESIVVKAVLVRKFKMVDIVYLDQDDTFAILFDSEVAIEDVAKYLEDLSKEILVMVEQYVHPKPQKFSWVEQEHLFN